MNQYTEPLSDDEEDEGNRHIATTNHEAAWADIDPEAAAEARAFREAQSKLQKGPGGQSDQSHLNAAMPPAPSAPRELFMKLTPANLSKLVQSRYEMDRDTGLNEPRQEQQDGASPRPDRNGNGSGISLVPGRVEYVSSFRASAGKKIAVPVRVEPKVFYANERTSACRLSSLFRATTDRELRSQRSPGSSSRWSCRRSASASSRIRTRTVSFQSCEALPTQARSDSWDPACRRHCARGCGNFHRRRSSRTSLHRRHVLVARAVYPVRLGLLSYSARSGNI